MSQGSFLVDKVDFFFGDVIFLVSTGTGAWSLRASDEITATLKG